MMCRRNPLICFWIYSRDRLVYNNEFDSGLIMQDGHNLFDVSKAVWESFSSVLLKETNHVLEDSTVSDLQWFSCKISETRQVMLGIDQLAGYQLAEDMLNLPLVSLSDVDEQDAVLELMNCICGNLHWDKSSADFFDQPKLLPVVDILPLLHNLKMVSDVTAETGIKRFYIAVLETDVNHLTD